MAKEIPENGADSIIGFDFLELITDIKMQLKSNGCRPLTVVDKPIFREQQLVAYPIEFAKNGNDYVLTFFMENGQFCVKLETKQQEVWRFKSSKLNALKKNKTKKNQAIVDGIITTVDNHNQ